jgi:hypothetical protein
MPGLDARFTFRVRESVLESLHAGFQILDFAPLLFDEQVLNSVQARSYLAKLLVHFPRNSVMSSLLAMVR